MTIRFRKTPATIRDVEEVVTDLESTIQRKTEAAQDALAAVEDLVKQWSDVIDTDDKNGCDRLHCIELAIMEIRDCISDLKEVAA